jgi:hypothetical protein
MCYRRASSDRRPLHDHKPRSRQVLDKSLGYDRGHEFVCIMDPFAPIEAQRKRDGVGEVLGRSWREAIDGVGHVATLAGPKEQDKNICRLLDAGGANTAAERCRGHRPQRGEGVLSFHARATFIR